MTMTLGRALADVMEDFRIGGYILGCEADATEITVWRTVQTSDGQSVAMFMDGDGQVSDVCRVEETFDLNVRTA